MLFLSFPWVSQENQSFGRISLMASPVTVLFTFVFSRSLSWLKIHVKTPFSCLKVIVGGLVVVCGTIYQAASRKHVTSHFKHTLMMLVQLSFRLQIRFQLFFRRRGCLRSSLFFRICVRKSRNERVVWLESWRNSHENKEWENIFAIKQLILIFFMYCYLRIPWNDLYDGVTEYRSSETSSSETSSSEMSGRM